MSAAPFPSPTAKWHTATYPSISPSRPALSGKGKTILITGGGTGIGAQTAHSFAAAGASRIALLGRREQPILTTKVSLNEDFPDVEIFVASTDITKKSEVDAAFAGFLGADGKIDVLVSNAATIGPQDPAGKVDIDKFTDAVAINLEGSLNLAQVFLKYAAEDAVVVEVNSSAAHLNFAAQFSCYSIAKLAVYRLWDSIAYAHPELRVYHIQPGVVDTDMNKEAGGVAAVGFEDHVSLPADFTLWLSSPEAKFLKGKFLWANWDVDEIMARAKEIESGTLLTIQLVGWPFSGGGWTSTWKVKE